MQMTIYIYIYIYIFFFIYLFICLFLYTYVYMYIYIYTYTYVSDHCLIAEILQKADFEAETKPNATQHTGAMKANSNNNNKNVNKGCREYQHTAYR